MLILLPIILLLENNYNNNTYFLDIFGRSKVFLFPLFLHSYMCDTVVAIGNSTKDGSVIFGKNSDRYPNEVQNIVYFPKEKHSLNSRVKCTYISIPQVEETYAVLLSKPFWMWGAEMGTNEYGVTIGNEAVWSKETIRDTGLLGMDMIRLALERATTALEALNTITSLLEKHGQGGSSKRGKEMGRLYHNSFIIADPEEAWVLETADKFWIAEKVKDVRTISNTLTIGKEFDLIHPDLIQHAITKGYCKSKKDFHFSNCFIPKFRLYHALKESQPRSQNFAGGQKKLKCTKEFMLRKKGSVTIQDIMEILRDHNVSKKKEDWDPSKGSAKSICHHAIPLFVPDQTTGSHVAHLKSDIQVHWMTGTSTPCTATFKPIFLPKPGLTYEIVPGNERFNPESLWWHHEKLQRIVLLDYQKRLSVYKEERDELEDKYTKQVSVLLSNLSSPISNEDLKKMKSISENAFKESIEKTEKWIKIIKTLPIEKKPNVFYRRLWNKYNKKDGLLLYEE
jgi:dipeptidase